MLISQVAFDANRVDCARNTEELEFHAKELRACFHELSGDYPIIIFIANETTAML